MAKNKLGRGKQMLTAILATIGLMGTGQSQYMPNNTAFNARQIKTNDATNQVLESVKPTSFKNNFSGGDNPYKYYRVGDRNQRQYRKFIRQNPNLRRSKKCRIKNFN